MARPPTQGDEPTRGRPAWKLAVAAAAVVGGVALFTVDTGDLDGLSDLVGVGVIVLTVIWILPSKITFTKRVGGDGDTGPWDIAVPGLRRSVQIPTQGAITDPAQVRRMLHEHGVELTEDEIRRAMREGGEVLERSVTIGVPPGEQGLEPSTTEITWNGRVIDQAAIRATGVPGRARVIASTDPIPDLFGPDVKLLDLELEAMDMSEPRFVRMVPVVVTAGREHEVHVGSTVRVRIDRENPEVVVVDL
ncbi:MAG: hypothetical protein WD096_09040 [Actinomycetota bacterium]